MSQSYGELPIRFEPNRGQTSGAVKFLSRGSGYSLFLTETGAVLRLRRAEAAKDVGSGLNPAPDAAGLFSTLRFRLEGSNRSPNVVGSDQLPGRSNYLTGGDARRWRTDIPAFAKVRYESVYPGVDVIYYGREGRLEYDFVVAPGASPKRIRLKFDGARAVSIDEGGDLILGTDAGDLRQQKPVAYQEAGGGRREVAARYVKDRRGTVRVEVGDYDHSLPLVIDPVLIYSSYLGGLGPDNGLAVAVDSSGGAYVCGSTGSTDFPGAGGLQGSNGGATDAFVLKLNPDGKSVAYATYLGGDGSDAANSVAVDSAGNAYVAGSTGSTNFPVTPGAIRGTPSGALDAFAAKLNPTGTALVYSTYLGGSSTDQIYGVAVDSAGAAYVAGQTYSFDFAGFPTQTRAGSPVQKSNDSGADWAASSAGMTASVVNDFAVAPGDPSVVYAATSLGVFKSTDGGASWQPTGQSNAANAPGYTSAVAVDPSDANTIYAATPGGGVFKSIDGGNLYAQKSSGISVPIVNTLAVDPSTPATLYAGTVFGVYKTTNGGDTWTDVSGFGFGGSTHYNKIVIDPTNTQTVYAAINRGMLKTTDGGAHWVAINNGLSLGGGTPSVTALALDPSHPSTLYAAASVPGGGVFKSADGGASWSASSNGLSATAAGQTFIPSISTLLVDPSSNVYAGTNGFGIFKSADGGANWSASSNGLTNKTIIALASRGGGPAAILAGVTVGGDAFAAKLNAAGTHLEYLRFLGGSENDEARGVAVGPDGSAYVAGTTSSGDFPTANAFQSALSGAADAFVTKLSPDGSALTYSTYLGGSSFEQGAALALGPGGEAYVTGTTYSGDFPLKNPLQPAPGDASFFGDAFVTKLAADGGSLVYSTYLGGDGLDQGYGIAVGQDGSSYVTGITTSSSFPVVNVAGGAASGNYDAFVTKLNPNGSAILFSTYLGGSGSDQGNGVAVNAAGVAYVVGNTASQNFPVVNAVRGTSGGGTDAFLAKFGVESDLAISETDSRDPVVLNGALTYSLKVTNAGPSPATGVVVTDTLPAGMTFVSATPAQGACGAGGQVVTCNLGDIPASGVVSISVAVTPAATGTLSNAVHVTANEPDSNQSNNSATETTKVSASPSINGHVTAGGGAGIGGVTLTLSGAQSATTQTDAAGFYQFAELPAGGTYVITPSKDNFSFDPPSQTFNGLGADQTADFTGTACTWTLSSSNQSVAASGGAGGVTVNTLRGCPWTASSSADWLTITSATSGAGTGTINFSVSPASAPRAAHLTIAGQNFAVYQEFDSCGLPDFSVSNYNLPWSPNLIKTADLNGDGRPDLIVSTNGLTGGLIQASVMLNVGEGRFTASSFDLGLSSPGGITLADFNGDGRPDIAMTGAPSSFARIFFNNGSGGFGQSFTDIPFGAQGQVQLTGGITSADLNRDGKPDLLVAATAGVRVLLGNGAGAFTPGTLVSAGSFDSFVDVADVNADGNPDLIFVGGLTGSSHVTVMLGDGAGGFGAPIQSASTAHFTSVGVGDFDGDGRLDFAMPAGVPDPNSSPSNPALLPVVVMMSGDGAGHFTQKVLTNLAPAASARGLVIADFNNDAKPDMAFSDGAATVTVILGDGAGGFGSPVQINNGGISTFPGLFGIVSADFDGDNRPDIAGADYTRGASVLRNNCAAAPHISGRVTDSATTSGLGGVTVSLGGAQSATTQTDQGGNYFFGNLTAGANYSVTPSKDNYRFSPASATVGSLSGGKTADFVATAMTVRLAQNHYLVDENAGSLQVDVVRTGDTSGAANVDYATSNGTASDRSDYTAALGTLRFAPGETKKSFNILLTDDNLVEGFESFTITLSNPSGALPGSPTTALVEIRDNDLIQPTGNPVDDSQFYVRQHYHDFLNREPDDPGLNFWAGQTTGCGSPDPLVCRVNVSAAFFLSIEFQETGFLVERMYKTAYGDGMGNSTLGGAHQLSVPVVRFAEFLRDTQEVESTPTQVVVGQGNWQQQLDENKNAFALEFVQRQRFATAFPLTMTADQFVNQLNANAGGVLTASDITQLDSVFGGASASSNDAAKRAQVLRSVAENATLQQQEFDRAFVLMQFFGYLRRNPNDAPDADYTGYDFWLSKLDQFHGNFVQAEMVKAFIASSEYRQRFGQP